jgi:predicted component of type VI protein secretion system
MEALLVMFKADGQRREFPLARPIMIVGRKHSCDLRIPISSVSREHCQVEIKDGGLFIRDLGSSNGTYKNEERVQESRLAPGDRITVGPVHFTVVIDGVPANIEKICTVLPNGGEVEAPNPETADTPQDAAKSSSAIPVAPILRANDSSPNLPAMGDDDVADEVTEIDDDADFPKPKVPPAPAPVVKVPPAPAKPAAAVSKPLPKAPPPPVAYDDEEDNDDPLAALAALSAGDDEDGKDVNDVLNELAEAMGGDADDDDAPINFDADDEEDEKPKKRR